MNPVSRRRYNPDFPKHKAAASECLAIAWLIEQGFEVFNNVSNYGPADLLAWKPDTGELLKIDVTTGYYYVKADGTRTLHFADGGDKAKYAEKYGIVAVVITPDKEVLLAPQNRKKI